jgi:hypothetical protein
MVFCSSRAMSRSFEITKYEGTLCKYARNKWELREMRNKVFDISMFFLLFPSSAEFSPKCVATFSIRRYVFHAFASTEQGSDNFAVLVAY